MQTAYLHNIRVKKTTVIYMAGHSAPVYCFNVLLNIVSVAMQYHLIYVRLIQTVCIEKDLPAAAHLYHVYRRFLSTGSREYSCKDRLHQQFVEYRTGCRFLF